MKIISILLLLISSSVFAMHHGKLDVIVFAIDLEINQGKEESAVSFVSNITENVKNNEPQTLVYQYHFSNKENKVFLLEIYPNNEAALFYLGKIYYHGDGLDVNKPLAFQYFKRASSSGHRPSLFMLAQFYIDNCFDFESCNEANKYFEESTLLLVTDN